jgi:hypothetical protein
MFPQFVVVGVFIGAVVQFIRLILRRSRSPLRDFGAWLYNGAVSGDRPGNMVHTVVTITPLMIAFTALKSVIPLIQPFSWDPVFERWDRVLGFGYAPWELIHPLIGYPIVTIAISIAYAGWFAIIFGALIWQAFFAQASATRMQYLLAFSFSWFIAGNVLAVVFSSVGPCYYGFLHSPDPYAAQMAYLRSISPDSPLLALQIQDRLWSSYAETKGANIGISAMPSMHVVASVLTALIAWRTSRTLGIVLTVYASIIVIGSFHLAWHYAVDAIAGCGLALLFWNVAGIIVRAQQGIPYARRAVTVPAGQAAPGE